jgi:hypothetical protein
VSFASLDTDAVNDLVDRFAGAGAITLIVGAGASMEASLPSWPALIERLLRRVASDHPGLTTEEAQTEWIRRTLDQEDLLAAGAIVEVMARDDLDTMLPEELFRPGGPSAFAPGPIANQVAYLHGCYGERLTILTTNYDDHLEQALQAAGVPKRDIKSYVRRRTEPPAGAVPVTHLHGYAGREGQPKRLVLTEEQYHRMQRGSSWQEQYVTERLEESLCLFVGTSLADPNLIRYLYGYKQSPARRHAAVFVRQGELTDAAVEVRAAREEAIARRWQRCGVEAIFVDHFADAAQLLYEIGHKRAAATNYERVGIRATRAVERIGAVLLLRDDSQEAFAERQTLLSRWLRETLTLTLRSALAADPPPDERLALALWLVSEDGRTLTGWAHSDRAHQDPATIEAVPIKPSTSWVAVRTMCQGVRVELDRQSEISRWRFVRGLPLVIEQPSRVPIGCLTVSSTKPSTESVLVTTSAEAKAALHRGLVAAIQPVLTAIVGARP